MAISQLPVQTLPPPNPRLILPTELKLQVVTHLDTLADIRNVRLASKDWAAAGSGSLFRHGFDVRPHRPDMHRLNAVSMRPELAKTIREITFYVGDVDLEQFKAAIDYECRRASSPKIKYMRKKEQELSTQLANAETRGQHCSSVMLKEIFPRLVNLTELYILSEEYPYTPFKVFESAWETMQDRCERFNAPHCYKTELSIKRYYSILSSSLLVPSKVRNLVVDMLPVEILLYSAEEFEAKYGESVSHSSGNRFHSEKIKNIKEAFENLTDLDIGFMCHEDGREYENVPLARVLGGLLTSAKQLKSLVLAYSLSESTPDFDRGFVETFYQSTFPALHSFRLQLTETNEKTVMHFLERHASTLKWLHLDDAVELDGLRTWKDFLTDMRDKLKLEKVEVLAEGNEPFIYDADWNPCISSEKSVPRHLKLLEMYVRDECPWPMHGDNPQGSRGWKPRFMGGHLNFREMTAREKIEMLAEDWETDDEDDEASVEGSDWDDSSDESHSTDGEDNDTSSSDAHTDDGEWEDEDDGEEGTGHDPWSAVGFQSGDDKK